LAAGLLSTTPAVSDFVFDVPAISLPINRSKPSRFQLRVSSIKALRAIDWKRDGRHIEDKVRHWFDIIGRELANPAILLEAGSSDLEARVGNLEIRRSLAHDNQGERS
jgi:hypothetical protein